MKGYLTFCLILIFFVVWSWGLGMAIYRCIQAATFWAGVIAVVGGGVLVVIIILSTVLLYNFKDILESKPKDEQDD